MNEKRMSETLEDERIRRPVYVFAGSAEDTLELQQRELDTTKLAERRSKILAFMLRKSDLTAILGDIPEDETAETIRARFWPEVLPEFQSVLICAGGTVRGLYNEPLSLQQIHDEIGKFISMDQGAAKLS